MSFSVRPAFTFNLNQIIVGSIKFGKYDGIHACLTAATTTDKILLHNPHKKINSTNNRLSWTESNYDIATLNFNHEIRAIETGCLEDNDPKEVLVIGSSSQLLAYHVDNNRDVFHREIQEGINTIAIGTCSSFDKPLVIVGGNQYIRGYNSDGEEVLWIVTSGNVNTLALFDINNDSKNEIICGCNDGTIKIYKNENLLFEITENTNIVQIAQVGKSHLLAYTLSDGTLGMYDESVRLWRIKSKMKGMALTSFDLLGTGSNQLITGWESGKVDVRDVLTGESLFKMNFNQVIMSVSNADYRGVGMNDLIICTKNGEVKGYEKSKVNLNAIKPVDQELIKTLTATKKNLLLELSHYLANSKINKDNLEEEDAMVNLPDNFGVIPANTRLQIAISTNIENPANPHVEIGISTNNETIIKAVIIFSEGIFESETLIGYSYHKPTSRIIMPFRVPKDNSYDIHIKVLVGYDKGLQFHVFELTRQLPKFSMYALCEDLDATSKLFDDPKNLDPFVSYVTFKLNERFQRICLWINQNFLLPADVEPSDDDGNEELRLPLISLYDNSVVTMWFYNRNFVKIMTKNMELAGNLIQSLTKFLNIDSLTSKAYFPDVTKEISQLFDRINGFQSTYTQLTFDITQKKNMAKNLILRAEDARLYNESALFGIYNDIYKLNEDLISTYTIRQQNYVQMQKNLDAVNNVLKSATKLRVGKDAAKMMQFLKEAVKGKNVTAITKIIETGEN